MRSPAPPCLKHVGTWNPISSAMFTSYKLQDFVAASSYPRRNKQRKAGDDEDSADRRKSGSPAWQQVKMGYTPKKVF